MIVNLEKGGRKIYRMHVINWSPFWLIFRFFFFLDTEIGTPGSISEFLHIHLDLFNNPPWAEQRAYPYLEPQAAAIETTGTFR